MKNPLDDIRELMVPVNTTTLRNPNVYVALEDLGAEPEAVPAAPAPSPAAPDGSAATTAAEAAAAAAAAYDRPETTFADRSETRFEDRPEAMFEDRPDSVFEAEPTTLAGAVPVGPEVLRWRREDDDIVPAGAAAGSGKSRLRFRR